MTYKPVYSHNELRREILNDPEARAIYEATKLQIELSLALKKARQKKGMTQDDVAKSMHTHTPAVSRIESGNIHSKHFPSLLTISKYASAIGYELNINLIPIKNLKTSKAKTAENRSK